MSYSDQEFAAQELRDARDGLKEIFKRMLLSHGPPMPLPLALDASKEIVEALEAFVDANIRLAQVNRDE
jgi:plasmid stability protein